MNISSLCHPPRVLIKETDEALRLMKKGKAARYASSTLELFARWKRKTHRIVVERI